MKTRRCPDAAPCEVVIAEFVFGVMRCREDAMREVLMDDNWYRCCDQHLKGLGFEMSA